jgi:hypothetical protein
MPEVNLSIVWSVCYAGGIWVSVQKCFFVRLKFELDDSSEWW